ELGEPTLVAALDDAEQIRADLHAAADVVTCGTALGEEDGGPGERIVGRGGGCRRGRRADARHDRGGDDEADGLTHGRGLCKAETSGVTRPSLATRGTLARLRASPAKIADPFD